MTPNAETTERRAHPRLPLGLAAHCQIDGMVTQEALGDLSPEGLFLNTETAYPLGARVRVVLGLPYIDGQRICSVSGEVTWIDRDEEQRVLGVGVKFDRETSPADRELLAAFLALWGPAA